MSIFSFSASIPLARHLSLCLISALLISTSFLTACGLSNERGDLTGATANESDGAGQEDDPFAIKELIGVRVESIDGKFNRVNTSQISIVTLDENFNEISSRVVPAYRVEERLSGGYEIQFAKSYIERVNQVVKVTFDQTAIPPVFLYAPLFKLGETQSITVNAKSHYVLKKLFDTINTPEALAELIPCVDSDTNCPNQPMAKANFLEQIHLAAQNYNVTIDPESSVEDAINSLDERQDLRKHVEAAVNEITRATSPFSKATRRNFSLDTTDLILNVAQSYNSVFFGLSFSDLEPANNDRSVNIAASSSVIIPAEQLNNPVPAYPNFTQSTSLFDMRRDILGSDIPFQRTILEISQNTALRINDTETENSLTATTTDTFLSTEGFLLNERVLEQTIFGDSTDGDANKTGWEFEPIFTRSYQVNDAELDTDNIDHGAAATWLTSANYSKAASFELTGSGTSLRRVKQLEDMHLFSWEVHGLETDNTLSTSSMNGKEYGVISYSLKFSDQENQNSLMLVAETAKWRINAGTIIITQPSSHYQTYSLSRAGDNSSTGIVLDNSLLDDSLRGISTIETQGSKEDSIRGLVQLDGQAPPQGHASQNGSYLAFAFNTKDRTDPKDRGQGIILASELAGTNFIFSGERYQLQGNSFEMNSTQNILHQLNGSSLVISAAEPGDPIDVECHASLSLSRTSVAHTVGILENTLSEATRSSQAQTNSQSCILNEDELRLEFPSVFGETLTLRGFITRARDINTNAPGNLINFIWQQDNQLGLIFANKEQALSPTFDE